MISNLKARFTDHPAYQYGFASLLVLLIIFLAQVLNNYLPYTSLLLVFLAGVFLVSTLTSQGPAIVSSLLSFLSFNFFFTEPYFTFDVIHQSDIATLVLFLLVALLTVNLASRMRRVISYYQQSLKRLTNFYDFSQKMSSATDVEAVMDIMMQSVRILLGQATDVVMAETGDAAIFVKHQGDSKVYPNQETFKQVLTKDLDTFCWHKGWRFFPIRLSQKTLGLIAINKRLNDKESKGIQTFCHLTSLALHRIKLVNELAQTKLHAETEQLRSALLSSVSHDLRTPLSSIIGAGTSVIEYDHALSSEDRQTLLKSIVEEAQRLDRHIQNLLDMTRFGNDSVKLERDWVDIHDIIHSAIKRMPPATNGIHFETEIDVDDAIIHVHGLLIEQAIVNLLDNAVKVSADNALINIKAHQDASSLYIDIIDTGPGIPDEDKEKVFDMFYSLSRGDNQTSHGLGLAICRGMIGAHGGQVAALNNPAGKGTLMRISLPLDTNTASGS